MNTFGLDIGSDTIKVIQVIREKNNLKLISAGMIKSPGFDINTALEKDLFTIAEAIKRLKSEAKISGNMGIISVPEKDVFSHFIEVPKMKDNELEQVVPFEAENLIPRPLEEVNLDWEVIENKESLKMDKIMIHIVAVSKFLIEKYIKIFSMAGIEIVDVESEMLAINRSLKYIYEKTCYFVLNIGSRSLDFSFLRDGNIYSIRSLPTSGESITRAISVSLGLDFAVAEEYKKTYGLTQQLEGKISAAIEPLLTNFIGELKKTIRFYQEKNKDPIKLVVLTGGTSLLPGLTEYLTKTLGMEVQIADPLSIFPVSQGISDAYKKNSPLFTTALGLAMKYI